MPEDPSDVLPFKRGRLQDHFLRFTGEHELMVSTCPFTGTQKNGFYMEQLTS